MEVSCDHVWSQGKMNTTNKLVACGEMSAKRLFQGRFYGKQATHYLKMETFWTILAIFYMDFVLFMNSINSITVRTGVIIHITITVLHQRKSMQQVHLKKQMAYCLSLSYIISDSLFKNITNQWNVKTLIKKIMFRAVIKAVNANWGCISYWQYEWKISDCKLGLHRIPTEDHNV
jgi:hypothetical protein